MPERENGREDYFGWISSNPGCSIILISSTVAEIVSKKHVKDNSATPAYKTVQVLYARQSDLKFKNLFVITSEIFQLCPVTMPDDKFHREFAVKFFGKNFAHYVSFEKIELPVPASA